MISDFFSSTELHPFPDHGLSLKVRRMGLTGNYQLYWAFSLFKGAHEPLLIVPQRVGSLISCEATGKANRQSCWVKQCFGMFNQVGRGTGSSQSGRTTSS